MMLSNEINSKDRTMQLIWDRPELEQARDREGDTGRQVRRSCRTCFVPVSVLKQ